MATLFTQRFSDYGQIYHIIGIEESTHLTFMAFDHPLIRGRVKRPKIYSFCIAVWTLPGELILISRLWRGGEVSNLRRVRTRRC